MTRPISKLIAASLIAIFCLTSFVTPSHAIIRDNSNYRSTESVDLEKAMNSIPFRYKTIFVDKDSGIEFGVDQCLHFDKPDESSIQAINIEEGPGYLHSEKSCAACAKLKNWYEKGEIEAIYNINIDSKDRIVGYFSLGLPWEQKTNVYIYQCVEGRLKKLTTATTDDTFWIESDSQSPFAVIDIRNQEALKDIDPHLYDPDDDEEEEKEWDFTIFYLLIAAGIIIFIVHKYKKTQNKNVRQ